MYTMPITLSPELDEKLNIVRRLSREYYRPQDAADATYRAFINGPQVDRIEKSLTFLSFEPHQAGTERDEVLAKYVRQTLLDAGLDRVAMIPYKVLLSYADPKRPNKVYVMDRDNVASVSSLHVETPVLAHEMHHNAVPAYNAYAPKGDVSGEPIYANYGREQDFELLLSEARIDVTGKICIIRYGKIFRGNKIANAARYGCTAVVLFSDPSLIAVNGTEPDAVYPNTFWMNGRAMQRGNVMLGHVRLAYMHRCIIVNKLISYHFVFVTFCRVTL